MRNEAGDIVQDQLEEAKSAANQWKEKAKNAGTAAWDATKATYGEIQDRTVAAGRATDEVIRDNPYIALGIAFSLGALVAYLLTPSDE